MKSFLNLISGWSDRRKQPSLPALSDIKELAGKRVLLRASLNVPVVQGRVTNGYRLERTIPTIKYLQDRGAKVIMVGHIGRELTDSLRPVYEELSKALEIKWGDNYVDTKNLQDGQVILLENLRQDPREKANADDFAEELADLADIYVNDAFSASHRSHASIVGVPKHIPGYFGLNFIREYEGISHAFNPKKPSLLIIGGSKFETKLPLIKKFASQYDSVLVSGALANDIYKAQGEEVGQSLVSDIDIKKTGLLNLQNIIVPDKILVSGPAGDRVTTPDQVRADERIVDAAPAAVDGWTSLINNASTILWNGPLGFYEDGYQASTEQLAQLIAGSDAHSIIGGGDTVASIQRLDLTNKFGFLSTAGGAMLTFLETGTLPAIEAISRK